MRVDLHTHLCYYINESYDICRVARPAECRRIILKNKDLSEKIQE